MANDEIDVQRSAGIAGLSRFVTMNAGEAARVARELFGVAGEAAKCAGEKDDTFKIAAGGDGGDFILKATDPSEDPAQIDLQLDLLDHLAATAPGLPVPRIRPAPGGGRRLGYRDDSGQSRQVWMMSFLPGTPLSELHPDAAQRRAIGETLGRLRLALADFQHPTENRVLPWDVKNLPSLEPLLANIADGGRRRQLEEGIGRFVAIEGRLATTRMQLLHNDFTKSNVLADTAATDYVSGIIDFGDAVRTYVAVDVSTALMNQLPRHPGYRDIFADARDVLAGYLRVADLTDEEAGLVPHLMMARVVARALLSISYSIEVPANAGYFLRNTEQGWHQLDWFLGRSIDQVSDDFLRPAAAALA